MRSKAAALLAHLLGDQLDVVTFVEIDMEDGPLRYVLDSTARTWDGEDWTPTSGALTEIQESAEREVPSATLTLQNVDGVLGPLLHPDLGGEDIRGRRVTIRHACRSLLTGPTADDLVIEWAFFVRSYAWAERLAVTLDLGVFPAEREAPDRTLQGLRCRWAYRGAHCGYTGSLATCDKTREDCRRHFEGEPLRFGGFPSSSEARALRLH